MWIVVPSTCSPCAPAGEDLTLGSEAQYQLLAQYVMWRGKPSQSRFWRRVCKTNSWMQRLSGQMLPRLTASRGVESWIASLGGTRVRDFLWQVGGSEQTTLDTCGLTSNESSGRSGPDGASLRTSGDTSPSASSKCGETFADLVTRLKLDYSQRRKSVRHTSENGSTSSPNWPTPAVGFNQESEDPVMWAARREECRIRKKNGNGFGMQLGMAVRIAGTPLWPTPRASANENRSTKPTPSQEKGKHGKYLASEVHRRWGGPTAQCVDMDTMERNSFSREALKEMKDAGTPYQTQTAGMLNPDWVSILQGYPPNWTDLKSDLQE